MDVVDVVIVIVVAVVVAVAVVDLGDLGDPLDLVSVCQLVRFCVSDGCPECECRDMRHIPSMYYKPKLRYMLYYCPLLLARRPSIFSFQANAYNITYPVPAGLVYWKNKI
mgnify:CR=1 FL=1